MAAFNIPGTLPNPLSMPDQTLNLSVTLNSIFDMGEIDVDKAATLEETVTDIEYHSMRCDEYEFDATSPSYNIDNAFGLYGAAPIYAPAFSYSAPPAKGIHGYAVAILIVCEKGSCIVLNNDKLHAPVTSIQYIPSPMNEGDFLFWADPNEPLVGLNEDGLSDFAIGLLGMEASTVTGVRLRVYSFFKFVERV